jgi:hypothetical protein
MPQVRPNEWTMSALLEAYLTKRMARTALEVPPPPRATTFGLLQHHVDCDHASLILVLWFREATTHTRPHLPAPSLAPAEGGAAGQARDPASRGPHGSRRGAPRVRRLRAQVFARLEAQGFRIDTVLATQAMRAHAMEGDWDEARARPVALHPAAPRRS